MGRVYVKVIKHGKHTMVVACDETLLGKVLREGKVVFSVNRTFYEGNLMSVEKATELMKSATIINIVGKEIVGKATREGIIHPEAVVIIAGVPHAQLLPL